MRMTPEDIARLSPAAQHQIIAQLAQNANPQTPARKYGNVPTEVCGIKFDSRKEAGRFQELSLELRAGKITNLRLQPEFTLQEGYTTPAGERIRAIRYRADFSYWRDGTLVIEDVKSDATRRDKTYRLKIRLMAERGFTVTEI